MTEKLKSRKFIIAVISAILLILNEGLNIKIPSETVLSFAGIIISYLLGQSYVDSKK